jgi:purine-binding chemotaxis protein CheW
MNPTPEQGTMYVTATVGEQLFGLPIARVQDVFMPEQVTPVPLAAAEIAGLINLRGRIVTMIDMRRRLGLPADGHRPVPMAIGVEWRNESYGLLIDEIGEVLMLPAAGREPAPANLDVRLARVAAGVHRLDEGLLMVLDVDRVIDGAVEVQAA